MGVSHRQTGASGARLRAKIVNAAPPVPAASPPAVAVAPPARLQHAYIAVPFAAVLVVFCWLVTHHSWDLLGREDFGQFYDAQAKSVLQGHLWVPHEAIRDEAFIRDGHYYGYFGLAPALLRIPLHLLLPALDGRWSRLSMLSACLLNLLAAYWLALAARACYGFPAALSRIEKLVLSAWILVVGLGSTNIFLASRAFVYHEAAIWAGAFAMLFACALVWYLGRPSTASLVLMPVSCAGALFSRPTAAVGPLVACVVLGLAICRRTSAANPLRRGVFLTGASVAIVIASLGLNYSKFRTFDGAPIALHQQYRDNPPRLAQIGGKLFRLSNVRSNLRMYLSPHMIDLVPFFPYVALTAKRPLYPEAVFDVVNDQKAGIPAAAPALFLLAFAGAVSAALRKNLRLLLATMAAMLASGLPVLGFAGNVYRYVHEFFPFLVVASAVGLYACYSAPKPVRIACWPLLAVLGLCSVYTNCTFAMEYQAAGNCNPGPDEAINYERFRSRIIRGLVALGVHGYNPVIEDILEQNVSRVGATVDRRVFVLGGRRLPVLFQHAPSAPLVLRTYVSPRAPMLTVQLGIAREAQMTTDGVEFVLQVRTRGGREQPLLRRYLDPRNRTADRGWVDARIDLSAYQGQRIDLLFSMEPGADSGADRAGWGDPKFVPR